MSDKEENPQFSEWFSDAYIDDDGFSEQLYLSLDKIIEKRNRTSRIISMLIMVSSMFIGLLYIFLVGFTNIGNSDFLIFIGIAFLTVVLSLEPET
jgi:hypothetical protein